MAKKRKPTTVESRASRPFADRTDRPIALTLKIAGDMYVRLSTLRAKQRRTHQEILKQALEEYLERAGV